MYFTVYTLQATLEATLKQCFIIVYYSHTLSRVGLWHCAAGAELVYST